MLKNLKELEKEIKVIFKSNNSDKEKIKFLNNLDIIGKFRPDGRFTGQQTKTRIWIWHDEKGELCFLKS